MAQLARVQLDCRWRRPDALSAHKNELVNEIFAGPVLLEARFWITSGWPTNRSETGLRSTVNSVSLPRDEGQVKIEQEISPAPSIEVC